MSSPVSEPILRPLPERALDGVWTDVLLERIDAETAGARSGQRLRIQDLPRGVLEAFASRASQQAEPGVEVYLVDLVAGPEPWRVGAHRVVQRRDADDAKV